MRRILGFLDILAGLTFLTASQTQLPEGLVLTVGFLLILKGFIFILDILSIFDILAGILLILTLFFSFPFWLLLIPGFYLLIKGTFSLF